MDPAKIEPIMLRIAYNLNGLVGIPVTHGLKSNARKLAKSVNKILNF